MDAEDDTKKVTDEKVTQDSSESTLEETQASEGAQEVSPESSGQTQEPEIVAEDTTQEAPTEEAKEEEPVQEDSQEAEVEESQAQEQENSQEELAEPEETSTEQSTQESETPEETVAQTESEGEPQEPTSETQEAEAEVQASEEVSSSEENQVLTQEPEEKEEAKLSIDKGDTKETAKKEDSIENVYTEKPKIKRFLKPTIYGVAASVVLVGGYWFFMGKTKEPAPTVAKHGSTNVAQELEKKEELAVAAKKHEANPDFLKTFPTKSAPLAEHSVDHGQAYEQFVAQVEQPEVAPVVEVALPEPTPEETPLVQTPENPTTEIVSSSVETVEQEVHEAPVEIKTVEQVVEETANLEEALGAIEVQAQEPAQEVASEVIQQEDATEEAVIEPTQVVEQVVIEEPIESEAVVLSEPEEPAQSAVIEEVSFADDVEDFLKSKTILSVLNRGNSSRMTLDNIIYSLGDTIDTQRGIVWSNINEQQNRVEFVDKMGNIYSKRY